MVREFRPVIILALLYICAVEIALWLNNGEIANSLSSYLYFSSTIMHRIIPNILLVLAGSGIWILWKNASGGGNNESLTRQLLISGQASLAKPEPWIRLLIMVIFYQPFLNAFSLFKSRIPAFQPFAFWDQAFMEMDRWLHFGFDPWQISWNIFSSPWMTFVIDRFYISWFYVIYGTLFAVILLDNNSVRRARFIFSHMLAWVLLGSIAAVGFSSAGPCFFENTVGPSASFAKLMSGLNTVHNQYPLFAIDLQTMLWDGYTGVRSNAEGIAAMPSLHIAQAALVALLAQTIGKRLGIAAWIYVFIIFIGSVHLGWHYAIDGYVSILAAFMIWWLAKKVIK